MKQVSWTKKLAAFVMAGTLGLGVQACDPNDMAVGLGLVAIGAGAVIIGGSDNDTGGSEGRYVCEGDYVRTCHTYRDYWGNLRQECRREWDSCARRVWRRYDRHGAGREALAAHLATRDAAARETLSDKAARAKVKPTAWATTFGMSFDGAKEFVSALEEARGGSDRGLRELGLGDKDIQRLASFRQPTKEGLGLLARNLNQDTSATKKMIDRLLKKGKQLKRQSDRQGPRHR